MAHDYQSQLKFVYWKTWHFPCLDMLFTDNTSTDPLSWQIKLYVPQLEAQVTFPVIVWLNVTYFSFYV
jgi:xylose isomerase